ncbi:MAG: tetratricopeptide repeat protein [Muribaculaceae bacterium]|nr:tetratricopeptide repeat protein [Muribaculaceae bacterium]
MLPKSILHLFILLSLIFSACTSESGRQLTHADRIMEEHPDSAMSILMDIDRRSLKGSDLPYYALLYTQAQVKTDILLDSDSLISIAFAKYGADTRGDRGIRSNFYTGEVFFNQEKYREAMRYYLTAYEESKRLRNDYWHAKAAERISDLFFFAYNYDEAERYALEAADLFKKVGRDSNNRYMVKQLAIILLNNGEPERAYIILDSLQTVALEEKSIDYAFLDLLKIPLIDAKVQIGKVNDIVTEQTLVNDGMSDREKIDAVILDSKVSNLLGASQNVKSFLKDMMFYAHSDEDKIHILYARYENAKVAGDTDLAISLVDSMLYYQNAVAEDIVKESVTGAQRDFYSQMAISHEAHSNFWKWMLVMAMIVFVLLVVVVVVFFILRNRIQKAQLQTQLEAFLSLRSQSDRKPHEKNTLKEIVREIGYQSESMSSRIQELQSTNKQLETDHNAIIEKLFKEKWTTLDALCDQYYGLDNSELNAKDLVANMQKELKKIVSRKGLIEIVEAVDKYMGGIVTDLRTQCGFMKEADINFLALLYAGFSVRAVCMFTGIKYDYFYVKKSRLIKRIETSDAPAKSLFLEKLK